MTPNGAPEGHRATTGQKKIKLALFCGDVHPKTEYRTSKYTLWDTCGQNLVKKYQDLAILWAVQSQNFEIWGEKTLKLLKLPNF